MDGENKQKPVPIVYNYGDHAPSRGRSPIMFAAACVGVVLVVWVGLFLVDIAMSGPMESEVRGACSKHLREIGFAMMMYSNDHNGQRPSEVGWLITSQGLNADAFVCPASGDRALHAAPAQQAATLLSGGHCSYVYVGAGVTSTAGDVIVAFELPDHHPVEGGNVLYDDYHVEWTQFDKLVQLVPELEAGQNPPVI